MLKLLFYIDSMQKGGANRVMANLTGYFADHGYDVTLVNDILPDENTPEYSVNPKVTRVYLNVENGNRLLSNLERIKLLRAKVKETNASVVVSFMGPPNFRMLLATVGLKARKIVSVRNDPYREYGDGLRKIIANLIFLLSDGCVFQTKDAAEYFLKTTRKKSAIIYNPVDDVFYDIERHDVKDIVMVGRFEPQKNPQLAIEAFAKVADSFPDDNMVLYGEGSLRKELENLINNKNLKERILLPGVVNDVPKALATAKIFLMSSDFEGMPNALMEAMAAGVPVISTDCPCGGPRMIIENEKQGILVECGKADQIGEAIRSLLSKEDLRISMGAAGRARAEIFKSERIYKSWETFLMKSEK